MKRFISVFCTLLFLVFTSHAASAARAIACSMNPPSLSVSRNNIFTEQQEQWLGDAEADMIEPRYVLKPLTQNDYVSQIGQKLLAQLPPTSIHYTFRVFESGDLRAFSVAGGHIYISRKLLLDARSEDELAAMLAQEVGTVYVHHAASVTTLRLKKLMNVKSVGDQADVLDKFQRLQNIPVEADAQLSDDDQKKDDLLADRVGLYALVKAGYAPQAFVSFLDRISLNGGYTGSFFSEIFENTPEVSVRIRQADKVIQELPDSCRIVRPQYRPRFKPFQDDLSAKRIDPLLPASPNLKSIHLDAPMSPALENVRLSMDGKYALAQDATQVHILSTAPPKLLFSIDAQGAQMAQFTPDSANVTFYYDSLRVENWNIATHQPAGILDFPDYIGCQQSSLSPDGNHLACFTDAGKTVWLRLTDLTTGKVLYQNWNFYHRALDGANTAMNVINEQRLGATAWSQDGRYFLAVSGSGVLCFDIKAQAEVKLQGSLSKLYEGRMAFVDSNRLVFECDWGAKDPDTWDAFKMCSASFPDGHPLQDFILGRQWLAEVTRGNRILAGPFGGSAAELLSLDPGVTGSKFKLETLDQSGTVLAFEAERGGLSVLTVGDVVQTVDLPVTPLPMIEASAFSPDGHYLAISDRARGATWDLTTGRRISYINPFRVGAIDNAGHLQANLIGQELKPSSGGAIDRTTQKIVDQMSVGTTEVQYGDVDLKMRSRTDEDTLAYVTELEADDAASGKQLWSRRFASGFPGLAQTDTERLLFTMAPRTETGDSEWRHHKNVFLRASDEIKKYDSEGFLIEVASSRTGEPQRLMLAPELPTSVGTGRSADLYGDLLAVHGSRNNTVIYRLSDGARLLAFFGTTLAGDAGLGLIAATNRLQDLSIYDVASGKELQRFTLDRAPLAAHFIPEKRQLLVLSATQNVYVIDLPAVPKPDLPAVPKHDLPASPK